MLKNKTSKKVTVVFLVGIFLLSLFSNGGFIIPIIVWISPVITIRYLSIHTNIKYQILAYLAFVVSFNIQWRGMIPIPDPYYYFITFALSSYFFLPFAINNFLIKKIVGFKSTLVLPVTWVVLEYLYSSFINPYYSWGSIAYTQFDNLQLLQIVSITGIYGITFIIGWFASVLNWIWENDFDSKAIQKSISIFLLTLILILLYGGVQLSLFQTNQETVRIASITSVIEEGRSRHIFDEIKLDSESEKTSKIIGDLHNNLFSLSLKEAKEGAKVILWSEASAFVFKKDEADLIKRGQTFAQQNDIYLFMALGTHIQNQVKRENKVIAITPEGEIAYTYTKARPVPGEKSIKGGEQLPALNTPYGIISSVICFDMDSPKDISKIGKEGVDILLVPSWDWKKITPYHTNMAIVRGIENGFSVVRQTNEGMSASADYHGRVLSSMNHFNTKERLLLSNVPTKGITTIYSIVGDLFAWMNIFIFFLFVWLRFKNNNQH
jgi:apolipoprotein N-acyltransferase